MNRWEKVIISFFCITSLVVNTTGCSTIASKTQSPSVNANSKAPNNESNSTVSILPDQIHMFDEQNGYGRSDDAVMVTSNGGATWTNVTPQMPGDGPGPSVTGYFVNAQTGWTFRLQPEKSITIYGTHDGGQSWSQLAIMPVKNGDGGMSVAFSDARRGWFEDLTAGNAQLGGELFATNDGGKTWQCMADSSRQGNLPFGGELTAQRDGTLWLSGGQRAGIMGGPGFVWLYRSTNGGQTWSQVNLPLSTVQKKETTSASAPVFFGKNGFVTVQFQGDSVLYANQDGSQTWSVRGTLKPESWLVFADAMSGWQVTSSGQIYSTKDGGRAWQPLPVNPILQKALAGRLIDQVDFVDSHKGWLVLTSGDVNLLLVTKDGGLRWSEVD